ncbi:MAG: hypothetical protein AAGE84_18300 [Cyanobacteria bacterium P01_G01_bin.39]
MLKTDIRKFKLSNYLKYFSARLLILLLITDSIFITLYLIYTFPDFHFSSLILDKFVLYDHLLLLTQDQSYGEIFQYIKELWIMLLLGFGYCQRKKLIFLSWSLFYGYLLLDDALSIHEKSGAVVSNFLGFKEILNIRSVDFGEVLVSMMVAISFLLLISWGYATAKYRERKYSNILILLILTLSIPGIVFDLLQVMVSNNDILYSIFSLLEDGGEHIVISLTLAFVYAIDWQF